MKRPWLMVVASVLVLAAANASAKQRHARHPQRTVATHGHVRAPSGEPARMIEIRPGVFVSSYECITDDGHGRWSSCSGGGGAGGGGGGM
jgi:hypothetical protein